MPSLSELTRQLAEGTRAQKRRSWRSLILEGGLWPACQAALLEASPLDCLGAAYEHLSAEWDRSPLRAGDAEEVCRVEQQIAEARKVVAAAALAALARGEAPGEWLEKWAYRAVGNLPPFRVLTAGVTAGGPSEARIRACFAGLLNSSSISRPMVAAAQDASLAFLWAALGEEKRPCHRRLRVPLLLARGTEGFLAWLWLEQVPGGSGQVFQAPSTTLEPILADLRRTIEQACLAVLPAGGDADLRWWLTDLPLDAQGLPIPVGGGSAAAAAAVGALLLLQDAPPAANCAVSATLTADGRLGPVEGLHGTGPKLTAARALAAVDRPARVIVSPESQLSAPAAAGWEARGVQVVVAPFLEEAVRHFLSPRETKEQDRRSESTMPLSASPRIPAPQIRVIYARDTPADRELLEKLQNQLREHGFSVGADRHQDVGLEWARETEREIRAADVVLVLLSRAAARSEMLAYELQIAHEAAQGTGKPRLLAVDTRVGAAPRCLPGLTATLATYPWEPGMDADALPPALLDAIRKPPGVASRQEREQLVPPTGVLPLDSAFYLERDADAAFRTAMGRRDSIIRIKGARQMGKTSLLARGLQAAREQDARVFLTDFQLFNQSHLESVDHFLLTLARWLARQAAVDLQPDEVWDSLQGASVNFRDFLLELLERLPGPVVWGLDEVDRLFTCPFRSEVFGLLRSLHNDRALNPRLPWSKLTMTLCYATEAHLFLADLNQSPFNVGTRILLNDFSPLELADLNLRYGAPLTSSGELAAFYELLAGHPYLSHRALHEMVTQELTLADLQRQANREEGLFGDHLRRLVLLLARDPALYHAVREVIQGRPCPTPESFHRLWTAGVLVGDSAQDARPRCYLYATYLERHLQ